MWYITFTLNKDNAMLLNLIIILATLYMGYNVVLGFRGK
jgi:hypothetical protein